MPAQMFPRAPLCPSPSELRQHITHGVLSLDLGGLERLVLDLAKRDARRGNRVTIVCVERQGKLAEAARELGAEVICLNKPRGRSSLAVEQATRLLDDLKPDVLHTHQIGALWYLGQAAVRTGLKCVVHTEHSDHVRQTRSWLGKVRARYLWWRGGRLAKRVCCVSPDIAAAVRRWGTVPAGRVAVVPNGIDVERYGEGRGRRTGGRRTDDEIVIGTVGRLNEVKRQNLLIEAFARLAGEFPQLRLLLVGDGPERQRLEEQTKRLGVAERVNFAGFQAQPEAFLRQMDVFALTSRHEAMPLSLLEAWASGLPVVASAVGGIPAIVEHGQTGLLFNSGDCEALIQSLRNILTDKNLASALADHGHAEVVAKYSLQRMADDYERQYQLAAMRPEMQLLNQAG
jgi:glycosyltransferase involved in cell wall biosynthesis